MVIDTSALMAILKREPEAEAFSRAIERDPVRLISAATAFEGYIVAVTQRGEDGGRLLDDLCGQMALEVIPVSARHLELARGGFLRFGKRRHPAGLNFGDCFSYALAVASGQPLLFKGGDFGLTDVRGVALPSS